MNQTKKESTTHQLSNEWSTVLGDYDLLTFIGKGTYGEVVKARHIKSQKIVAIKLVKDIFDSEQCAIDVVREVQILRQLSQMDNNRFTNVLYDLIFSEDMNNLFIVIDYVESDLKRLFQHAKNINKQQILVIVYKFLCALNFIQTANIMHRDIKPANILIDNDCNIKFCDFGLSRTYRNNKNTDMPKNLSRTEIAENLVESKPNRLMKKRRLSKHMYTRWYRPPEIILCEKKYDTSSDIWAAGCVISEILYLQNEYTERGFDLKHNRFIFKGDSCFPLSPIEVKSKLLQDRDMQFISRDDQLKVILKVMGHLSEQDTSFVSDDHALDYMKGLKQFNQKKKINFDQKYPFTNSCLTKILSQMLEFNPHYRKSAKELLKNPMFDSCRREFPGLEFDAEWEINLECDKKGAYNYAKDRLEGITLDELKFTLLQEEKIVKQINKFNV